MPYISPTQKRPDGFEINKSKTIQSNSSGEKPRYKEVVSIDKICYNEGYIIRKKKRQ